MSRLEDRRIGPSELSPEILGQLDGMVHSGDASLVSPNGERVLLPKALNELLVFVVDSIKRKQSVFLTPGDQALTTQAAATFLGMSRPYLLKLLAQDKIPYHRVGTHRRVMFKDVIEYREKRNQERRRALTELTQLLDEAGVYDRRLEPIE